MSKVILTFLVGGSQTIENVNETIEELYKRLTTPVEIKPGCHVGTNLSIIGKYIVNMNTVRAIEVPK